MFGCSSSNSLINKEPFLYTIENPDGSKTKVKSHLTGSLIKEDYETLKFLGTYFMEIWKLI